MADVRAARRSLRTPTITFLWHPGTTDIFSGYGLVLGPAHLVGLGMVDRLEPVDPAWLAWIEHVFGFMSTFGDSFPDSPGFSGKIVTY